MRLLHPSFVRHRLLLAVLLAIPCALWAQAAMPQESDWRRANDAVGALQRGHADVLKWEQANTPVVEQTAVAGAVTLPTAEAAVRLAWKAHPDLGPALAQLGAEAAARIAQGRWLELDPALHRRVHHLDDVLQIAVQARKVWIDAVVAQQVLHHSRSMVEATAAAQELGARMVAVGNWSKLQLAPATLAHANARMAERRAQYALGMAQSTLVRTLQQTGRVRAFELPVVLPKVPAAALAEATLQPTREAVASQLPVAERARNAALLQDALRAYQAAHALALDSTELVLTTRAFITEETVLHYNGMLKSVWDLLGEARAQSQATVDALSAQRDFWTAEADLLWVLHGGEPTRFVSLQGGGGGESAAAAGH